MALKREITEQIRELLRQHPGGLSITAIVRQIAINRNTAGRYLENLMVSGQVEMRHFGMAKIYRLAQRVPLSAMLSISAELIMLLDNSLRVIYANEPMLRFLNTTAKDLYGRNIEYTPCITLFNDAYDLLKKGVQNGIAGKEWSGELVIRNGATVFSCRIAPTVFEAGERGVSVLLEDITVKKSAEQRLFESERQFRLLAENSLDVIARFTPDGTCMYISPACRSVFGFRPVELVGHSAFDTLHPDDCPVLAKVRQQLTRKSPAATVTSRIRHKDGHYVWVESSLRAIFDEETGSLTEIYSVTRDISGRIRADETLRESEDRYRKLVEISPDAVLLHYDDRIAYLNPAAVTLLGARRADELIGKKILDIVHPDFHDRVRSSIEKDLAGNITPPMELSLIRLDGTQVFVEGRGVRTSMGGRPAVQVAMRDITDRKKAEEKLRESEATARALLNAPTDSILLLDTTGKILDANMTAVQRLGRTREELIGAIADTVFPPAVACIRRDKVVQVLETKTPARFEDHRDGIWFDTVAYPILNSSGEVIRLAIVARDITDRKHMEEDLLNTVQTFRMLAENAVDIISRILPDGTCIYVSPAVKWTLGYDPEEVTGKSGFAYLHPDDRKEVVDTIRGFEENGADTATDTFRMRHKDGSYLRFEATIRVIRDGKTGRVREFYMVSRDTGIREAP